MRAAEIRIDEGVSLTALILEVMEIVTKEKWCPIADRHCLKEECMWWSSEYNSCNQNVPVYVLAGWWRAKS